MAYVITAACVDVKDGACVEVCPVDCITSGREDRMLFIEPDECIDCGACVDVCPVDAIYAEEDVPPLLSEYIELNRRHFADAEAVRERVNELCPVPVMGGE